MPAAVGSINNTFGCPGVEENTFFFKSITDANKLRRQVSECFERASLPELDRTVGEVTARPALVNTLIFDKALHGNVHCHARMERAG